MSGGVADVHISNTTMRNCGHGIRIKTGMGRGELLRERNPWPAARLSPRSTRARFPVPVRPSSIAGGYVKNITLTNASLSNCAVRQRLSFLHVKHVGRASDHLTPDAAPQVVFQYDEFYGGHPKGYDPNATPTVDGLTATHIVGSGNQQIGLLVSPWRTRQRWLDHGHIRLPQPLHLAPLLALQRGLEKRPMTNVFFQNVHLEHSQNWTCSNVEGSAIDVFPAPPSDCFTSA